MPIYTDSVVLIYLLDHTGPFRARAMARIASLQAAGDQMAVSDLTRLECRIGPLKRRDAMALAAFDAFFAKA
jgi:predicted nucleic acid-binding protein